MTDPRVCAGCGAVSKSTRWYRPTSRHGRLALHSERLQIEICPRCRNRRSPLPHGYVHVDGPFAKTNRRAIESLIREVSARVHDELPDAHLLSCEDDGAGGLLVTTSLGHVAARIGEALEAKYDGQLHYGVVPGAALAHVWWRHER